MGTHARSGAHGAQKAAAYEALAPPAQKTLSTLNPEDPSSVRAVGTEGLLRFSSRQCKDRTESFSWRARRAAFRSCGKSAETTDSVVSHITTRP